MEKKAIDNSNVITFRAPARLSQDLQRRIGGGFTSSSHQVAQRDLERYYYMLCLSLPAFTEPEALTLAAAMNGHIATPETAHLLWAEIDDFLAGQPQNGVDRGAFVARLRSLSRFECIAIEDAIERAWNAPEYHVMNMAERLRQVGLARE